MTIAARIKFGVLGLAVGIAIAIAPVLLGYQIARGDGPPIVLMAEAGADPADELAAPAPAPTVLEQLTDLRAKYEALKAAKGTDGMMLAWAALIAGALKVLLSAMVRLWPKPKKWTAWVAMSLAVPIALLSHFAAGHTWLESLIVAGGGPGAVIVHELLKLIPTRKAALPAISVALALLVACGPSARHQTLVTLYKGASAAQAGFVAWDARNLDSIASAAPSVEAGLAAIGEYKTARAPVLDAFEAVYRTIAAAALLDEDQPSLVTAVGAFEQLRLALRTLTKGALP